jgi:hypothetical protein
MVLSRVKAVCMLAALVASVPANPALSKTTVHKAGASSGTCARLNGEMEQLKKSLAMNFADGIGDNSAPRATMREAQYQSLLGRVRLTMDLMRDNRCKMPTSVPTGVEYASAAIACASARMEAGGASSTASCDQSKWVPAPR